MAKGQTNAGSPIIEVDSNLDLYSKNPVQNKVVTEALDAKQDTLIQGSGITISNNTISVTDSDKYLKNDATANYAYAIGGTSNKDYAIGIGYSSNAIGTDGAIAIGRNSTASGSGSIAIGSGLLKRTTASGTNTVAIGDGAQANAANATQLGSGINNNSGTLQFRSYQLLDSNGLIPDERISTAIARVADLPIVNDSTITLTQGGEIKGTFTTNSSTDTVIELDAGGSLELVPHTYEVTVTNGDFIGQNSDQRAEYTFIMEDWDYSKVSDVQCSVFFKNSLAENWESCTVTTDEVNGKVRAIVRLYGSTTGVGETIFIKLNAVSK